MDLRHEFAFLSMAIAAVIQFEMDTMQSRYTRCFEGSPGLGKGEGQTSRLERNKYLFYIFFTELEN